MALQVWLPLNGNFKNNGLYDLYNPILAAGNSWVASGKITTSSLALTKIQTILPQSSNMTGAKEMSYTFWVKVNTAWETQWLDGIRWITTDGSTTHTSRQEFYTNCTRIGTWYAGGNISGKVFTPGVWTHIAATFNYNTGVACFYLNGILEGTATNLSTTHYCRGDFYIGDSGVDILENDVRIYDHALSPKEVKEISKGLVLHYPLDNHEDAGEGNIVYDCSGYGHHGMWYGNQSTATDTARYSKCTYLDNGQTTYIQSNGGCGNPSDAITMNIWFKSTCTTPGSNYHEIFNHATSSQYFEFAIYKSGYFRQGMVIDGTRYVINGGSGLLDGKWHMLTATYDGSNIKRYIDGVIIDTMTQTITGVLTGANGKFLLGHYGPNTSYYAKEAYLSDARIYATALSAADILELYKTAAVVDNQQNLYAYEFVEDVDAQVYSTGVVKTNSLTETTKTQIYNDGQIKANALYEF